MDLACISSINTLIFTLLDWLTYGQKATCTAKNLNITLYHHTYHKDPVDIYIHSGQELHFSWPFICAVDIKFSSLVTQQCLEDTQLSCF